MLFTNGPIWIRVLEQMRVLLTEWPVLLPEWKFRSYYELRNTLSSHLVLILLNCSTKCRTQCAYSTDPARLEMNDLLHLMPQCFILTKGQ
jgi:hypothetical protein